MAATTLTVQKTKRGTNGLQLAYTNGDNVGGHDFLNDGEVLVIVNNTSASPITATFKVPLTVDGAVVADLVGTVAVGKTHIFVPFPPSIYNSQLTGKMSFTLSAGGATTTVAVLSAGPGGI